MSTPQGSGGLGRFKWLLLAAAVVVAAFFLFRPSGGAGTAGDLRPSRPPTPVRVAAVAQGDLAVLSSYNGELKGEVSDIAPQVTGILREVPVRIGDEVRAGDLLAKVDDVDLRNQLSEANGQLGVARANLKRSDAELIGVEADHRRSVELFEENLISAQEFDRVVSQLATARATVAASEAQVEQATARAALLREQVADTRILAPFDGVIADRYLDRGTLVQPQTPILRLVEASAPIVQFRVPERDLAVVRPGVELSLTTQATGDSQIQGTVLRVSGEISRSDRLTLVEGELDPSALVDHGGVLRSGMYAEIRVQTQNIESALVVPGASVLDRIGMDGSESSGVLVEAGGKARWVEVEVLGESRGRVAVLGSLSAGDLVLTLGHSELEDGSPINVVQRQGADTSLEGVDS